MSNTVAGFPPIEGAIAQAESWKEYLTHLGDLRKHKHAQITGLMRSIVGTGIRLGELLPLTWRLTFDDLINAPEWITTEDFEKTRQSVRRLFFTVREALELTWQMAQRLPEEIESADLERLQKLRAEAQELEATVFRDWPSFTEPMTPSMPLTVVESLAEALGISVAEAQEKMDARRREHELQGE